MARRNAEVGKQRTEVSALPPDEPSGPASRGRSTRARGSIRNAEVRKTVAEISAVPPDEPKRRAGRGHSTLVRGSKRKAEAGKEEPAQVGALPPDEPDKRPGRRRTAPVRGSTRKAEVEKKAAEVSAPPPDEPNERAGRRRSVPVRVSAKNTEVEKEGTQISELSPDEPSERPDRHRSTLVRRSMLNAAAELFAERGFGGTNLRDVADVLGMSRPGLYYHFPSKEKILEALIEEVTFSFAAQLDTITTKQDQDPEEALRNVVSLSAQWVLENPVMFRVLDRSEAEIPEELKGKHDASKKVILEHFTDIIKRGIAIGKFRPVDPHVASLTLAGMCNWTSWWFKPEGRLHRNEIAAMIAEMAVRSLLRADAHRSRSDRVEDVLRILKEDVAHLDHLLKE